MGYKCAQNLLTLGRVKDAVKLCYRLILAKLAYGGVMPGSWADRTIAAYWDFNADGIHARWGRGRKDFLVLSEVLKRYRPQRLLDVGCGSGRLFELYRALGMTDITGTDISARALQLARLAWPDAVLQQVRVEELEYSARHFDLGVCNRVLQHVSPSGIALAVQKVAQACHRVYVNELTQSDDADETSFMRRYDYTALFAQCGLVCLESGSIDKQTYFLFGPPQEADALHPSSPG